MASDAAQPTDRLHALDAVRAFALLLGIVLHGTMPFLQDVKGWAATDPPSQTMAGVWYVIHMFRMPVFFLIAGFFGRMLLERRGTRAFIDNRIKRILVPLVAGLPVVLIATAIMYVLGALAAGTDLRALQEAAAGQREPQGNAQSGFSLAHLWFLYYLLIFYAGALALRACVNAIDRNGRARLAIDATVRFLMRGIWGPVLLAAPTAVYFYLLESWPGWNGLPAPFSLGLNAGALIGYGMLFGFGWLLHRQSRLMLTLERSWPVNLAIAVVLAVVCVRIAGLTPHWEPYLEDRELLVYAPAYMIAVWFWSFGLIGAAVRFLSGVSPVRRYLADSSYWLYLMHVPVLLFFHVMFDPLDWHWSVKYLLSIAGTVPILLLSYHYLVRSTFIGVTLNGRRHPRARASSLKAPAAG